MFVDAVHRLSFNSIEAAIIVQHTATVAINVHFWHYVRELQVVKVQAEAAVNVFHRSTC